MRQRQWMGEGSIKKRSREGTGKRRIGKDVRERYGREPG